MKYIWNKFEPIMCFETFSALVNNIRLTQLMTFAEKWLMKYRVDLKNKNRCCT